MKRCSTSRITRELQIKTTMRYHYTAITIVKIQNTDNIKCWWECRALGTLIHCCWEYIMVQPLWKTVWQFPTKLNICLPYKPAISLHGIYSVELKNLCPYKAMHKDVYSSLTVNCQNLEATKIFFSKLWYFQILEYYTALKRNELSSHEQT